MKVSQRKCYHMTHEVFLHNMYVKPSLAETHFRLEVRRLKCAKYELDKISSSVDNPLLRGLIEIMSPGPSDGVQTTRRYSNLGIFFENPLKSHTHCLTACGYHLLNGWLLIIGNLGLC